MAFTKSERLKTLEGHLENMFDRSYNDYIYDIEDILDEAEVDGLDIEGFQSKVKFRIHSSCKVRNAQGSDREQVLQLSQKVSSQYLIDQTNELLRFAAVLKADMKGNESLLFNVKKVYVCSKKYDNQTLRLNGEELHFNPQTAWRKVSQRFMNRSQLELLTASDLRDSWDNAEIFEIKAPIQLKVLWKSILNPASTANIQLRKTIKWSINSILKYKSNELSPVQVRFLQTRAEEEVMNAKIAAVARKVKQTKINLVQVGAVNHSNFHDIDVLVNFNSIAVDTFAEDFKETPDNDSKIVQVGIVNTYSVDLVKVNLNVSEDQIIDVTKKFVNQSL